MAEATTTEEQDIDGLTKLAVIVSLLGFILPFIGGVAGFVLATIAKIRVRRHGGDRTSEGFNTIAQITAVFTLVLYGGFTWYVQYKGWNT